MVKKQLVTGTIAFMMLMFTVPSLQAVLDTPVNLRGWHTDGQTFLVWEHSTSPPRESLIYEIYSSPEPIHSTGNATLIGKVFSTNGKNSRLQNYIPDARWVLPVGSGSSYEVGLNESYFVVTPHEPGIQYYAVVSKMSTIVESGNRTGPIMETTDPVECHLQYEGEHLTIYGHWIDGRSLQEAGRWDYPVMGNEHSNGLGYNIALFEPTDGRAKGLLPMVIRLHGIAGNFVLDYTSMVVEGFYVLFDDKLELGPYPGTEISTAWFGYSNEFDRFSPGNYPGDSATIVNYTARRVWWETDWLIENISVDPLRVSIIANSLGGAAGLLHTELRPDLYAAGIATVPPLIFGPWSVFYPLFGTGNQNLPTNLKGRPGIWDLFSIRWRVQQPHPDWPYALIVNGKNEDSWQAIRDSFVDLDEARTGYALYWDEREHGDWQGAHFNPSEHLNPFFLTRFYKNKSFPAFSSTDTDIQDPGLQPEIGNGNPNNGDSWGTWGGYLEWDTKNVVDQPDRWECIIWITSESFFENDIPDTDIIQADVTPRRLQKFDPDSERFYAYQLIDNMNGKVIQEGIVAPNEDGTLTIKGLLFSKRPQRLSIREE